MSDLFVVFFMFMDSDGSEMKAQINCWPESVQRHHNGAKYGTIYLAAE